MELEVTWARSLRVWWALLWRHVLVALGAMVIGGIVGAIIGIIGALSGAEKDSIIWPARVVGGLIGLAATTIPVRWVLGKRFGKFRVVLVSTEPPPGQILSPPLLSVSDLPPIVDGAGGPPKVSDPIPPVLLES